MVDGLLDDLLEGRDRGVAVDLVSAYAAPLPIAVITDLLGIPDADAAAFTRYGSAIGGALGGIRSLRHARELARADAELDALFAALFERRRIEPRDDLISDLVAVEGDQIRPEELRPMCGLLLIAGFETTVNLIGNAVHTLLDHPEEWERLVADPERAAAVCQETLRFEPPVHRTARISFDETEVGAGRSVCASSSCTSCSEAPTATRPCSRAPACSTPTGSTPPSIWRSPAGSTTASADRWPSSRRPSP